MTRSVWLVILVLCVSVGACASCKSREKPVTHVEVTERSAYKSRVRPSESAEGYEGSELSGSGSGSGSGYGVGSAYTAKRKNTTRTALRSSSAERENPAPEVIIEETTLSLVDKVIASLRVGNIAFSTPENMGLNESADVVLLLSLQDHPDMLAEALEGRVETAEGIKISSEMEAILVGDGFAITPVTPTKQAIGSLDTTTWKWKITSKAKGPQELYLSLNARVQVEGKDSPYVVQTFLKRIRVEVTFAETLKTFLSENWQWLWTTILLPLLVWYFKRRNKPKKTS